MSWPFDTSEPFITAEHAAELQRLQRGVAPEAWALPRTMVATFQSAIYERLLERAGVGSAGREDGGSPWVGQALGAVDGVPMLLARIGVGAPAAAMVLEQAIARGVRNILVAGDAGSLQPGLPIGSTVIVEGAEREDGASRHYLPAGEVVAADPEIVALLEQCAVARGATPVRGRAWTIDAPYRETVGAIGRHRAAGVAVVEMEAAAIFAVARVRGARAGLLVVVSDELYGARWHVGFAQDAYLAALTRATDAALDAAARLG